MKKSVTLLVALCMVAGMAQSAISDYTSKKDIDYVGDGHTGHKMDIYYPNDEQTKHPVIIHIYGSSWSSNNKKDLADLGTVGVAALEAGYVFIAPNHRSSSDAIFPAQLQDIKALVRYLRGNAETLKLDTSFIAISGFSSGGHLAVLMGLTRGITEKTVGSQTIDIEGSLGDHIDQSSYIDAACAWAGVMEIRDRIDCDIPDHLTSFIVTLMGGTYASNPDGWALASTNTYVDAKNAPIILFHGSEDIVCPLCVSDNLYNNLQAANVESEFYSYNEVHCVNADYTDEMITFLNKIKAAKAAATAIDQTNEEMKKCENEKILRDGQLIILRDGKMYNVMGGEVK